MTAVINALTAAVALFAPHTGRRVRRRLPLTALTPWPMAAPNYDTDPLERA